MNVQAVLQELDQWHDLIVSDMDSKGILELYRGFVREEIKELQEARTVPEIIKEACDVIVVCRPLINWGSGHDMKMHHHITESVKSMVHEHGVNWWEALHKVNVSNFSKLILESEVEQASDHFAHLGIDVQIESLGSVYFGAYSTHDQEVNGKFYADKKLLKAHTYHAIDESVEWWL